MFDLSMLQVIRKAQKHSYAEVLAVKLAYLAAKYTSKNILKLINETVELSLLLTVNSLFFRFILGVTLDTTKFQGYFMLPAAVVL